MTDSPSCTTFLPETTGSGSCTGESSSNGSLTKIPIEIVSDEEMSLIEAAMGASLSSSAISSSTCLLPPPRPSLFLGNARLISTITALSKRQLLSSQSPPMSAVPGEPDVEDSGGTVSTQKRNRPKESFLGRFRKRRGLAVTDLTATEWCEKQMEYVLTFQRRKTSQAMKAGSARHVKLEEEVVKGVEVSVHSYEDVWALKFLNFITGADQLLSEGLTRELPLIGYAEGVLLVGKVDEILIRLGEDNNPILIETKTRVRATLPSEPQRRNARLQVMCYKFLWDNLVANKFPFRLFCESFHLNPYKILSEDIRKNTSKSGIQAKTLDDVVRYYTTTCSKLLPADNQMFLRYELQEDNSVIGEDEFTFDLELLKSQIHIGLEFWKGEREAMYAPEAERWKCRQCQFSSVCTVKTNSDQSRYRSW